MSRLRVYLDASGQTWHDVPGYGRVNWTLTRITEHARETSELHRPDRTVLRRRCKMCGTRWMCRKARWADDWMAALERGRSKLVRYTG